MNQAEVAIFQEACGQKVSRTITWENNEQAELYANLIREEVGELLDAFDARDIEEVADGAADAIWVILGLCNTMGIPINPVWREVMLSNMSKIPEDGVILRREDGKVLKPASFFPPNIKQVLGL